MIWTPQTFHVTGFHANTTACELTVMFEKAVGEVYRIDIPPRSLHGNIRPYAFVQFMRDRSVERIETLKLFVGNKPLFIRLSHNSRNPDQHKAVRSAKKSQKFQKSSANQQYRDLDAARNETENSNVSYHSPAPMTIDSNNEDLRSVIESKNLTFKRMRSPSHEEVTTKRPRAETPPVRSPFKSPRSPSPIRGRSRSRSTSKSTTRSGSISSRDGSVTSQHSSRIGSADSTHSGSRSRSRSTSSRSRSRSRSRSVGSVKSVKSAASKNSVRSMSRSRSPSVVSQNSSRSRSRSVESAISSETYARESSVDSDIEMVDRE